MKPTHGRVRRAQAPGTRGLSPEDQAAVLRCKGQMSARGTAAQFGVSHRYILDLWNRGPQPEWDPDNPPFPPRWRCGCGALAEGDGCVCGEAAAWVKEQRYIEQVTRELEAA